MNRLDPETRTEYERRAKALSDERSRVEDAEEKGKEAGISNVVKSLLDSGMPLYRVAVHTPYSVEEITRMLQESEE